MFRSPSLNLKIFNWKRDIMVSPDVIPRDIKKTGNSLFENKFHRLSSISDDGEMAYFKSSDCMLPSCVKKTWSPVLK